MMTETAVPENGTMLQNKSIEHRQAYADEILNLMVCTRTAISRLENVHYSAWNIRTLKKIADAFDLRLHVSFETFDSLDVAALNKEALERALSVDENAGLASAGEALGAAAR
ncbi:MAG: hypothetical protein JXP48_09745 [Acidobacteria bacterium]|nr:hypothetical protein [Acidobacteriota bacterium]